MSYRDRSILENLENWSLGELGLDAPPFPEVFAQLTVFAARLTKAPVALVSMIDAAHDRQIFIGQNGLGEPWAQRCETPLSHSFCKLVRDTGAPLIVTESHADDRVRGNLAIRDLSVRAYCGVPVSIPGKAPLGAICAISPEPREWSAEDLSTLDGLARCVSDELLLLSTLRSTEHRYQKARRYSALRETIATAFMAPNLSARERFEALLRASCEALHTDFGWITRHDGGATDTLFDYADDRHAPPEGARALPADRCLDDLRAKVLSDQSMLYFTAESETRHCTKTAQAQSGYPCRFISAPLVIDGALYGTVDFASSSDPGLPWSEEELSVMAAVSMTVCTNLGYFDQIRMLRASEAALVCENAALRREAIRQI